jgi:hypothetical protein
LASRIQIRKSGLRIPGSERNIYGSTTLPSSHMRQRPLHPLPCHHRTKFRLCTFTAHDSIPTIEREGLLHCIGGHTHLSERVREVFLIFTHVRLHRALSDIFRPAPAFFATRVSPYLHRACLPHGTTYSVPVKGAEGKNNYKILKGKRIFSFCPAVPCVMLGDSEWTGTSVFFSSYLFVL